MNTISLVNAVHVEVGPDQQFSMSRQQYGGCFHSHIKAEQHVTISSGDGYFHKNTRYNYCVIKEITLELYPRVIREDWFKWINDRYAYVPKPSVREIISGYSSCIGKRTDGSNIG